MRGNFKHATNQEPSPVASTDESVFRPHFIVEILMKNLEQFNELKGIKISVENQQIKYINGYNFEDVFYFKPKESAIAEPQGVDPGDLNLVIDPGHGGTDPGAYNTEVSGSIYEKTATLDIGLKLRSYCGSLAKSIYMTRTTDETVGETLRESRINNSGGNLLISIHHNSTTNHTANGIETYYYDSADHYIADDVHIKAKEAYFGSTYGYFSDRGVKYGNYYVLRDTTVPGCLVEAGFISNTDHDYQIINSSSYRDEIAYHLYLGIRNYWLGY